MTDPVATLIVELSGCQCAGCPDHRDTVRIDGDLPTVEWLDLSDPNTVKGGHRPLHVGDRVTLATNDCPYCVGPEADYHTECIDPEPIPFATATVSRIEPRQDYMESSDSLVWLVTVTDVEALS